MKRSLSLVLCLSIVVAFAGTAMAADRDYSGYQMAVDSPQGVLQKSTGSIGFSKAQSDTFYLYGGLPGSNPPACGGNYWPTGMFQQLLDFPGGNPEPQGWVGVDLTVGIPFWRATTVNAQDFDGAAPGNHGMMSNNSTALGGDYDGYGNAWNDWSVLTIDISALSINPGDPSTVNWVCDYVHDVEPGWDFFQFDANVGGAYSTLLAQDGSSYVDTTGTYDSKVFDSDNYGGISYAGGDYVDGQYIQLRFRVTSDGAWSDQDGLWPTFGRGAGGVDNVVVTVNGNIASDADFEPLAPKLDNAPGDMSGVDNGASSSTPGWTPTASTFAGDFSKLFGQFLDIDPCRDNLTPQFTFIDDGTPPNNGGGSTGGSISSNWNYGIPGGWVINYEGGLTLGESPLDNQIWSPPFAWDLPCPDDDVANGGAVYGFTRWSHMPLTNGIFATWSVRSRQTGGDWSTWNDNNFVYYSNAAAYGNFRVDVSEHIMQDPDDIQINLAIVDLADAFDFPGNDATAAPNYDNVYFAKYTIGGPVMSTRTIDLASDGYPNDGTLTGSIRWDANIDTGPQEGANVPADSVALDIIAVIPGTELLDASIGGRLKVAHLANPAFDGARAAGLAAVAPVVTTVDPDTGWNVYTYDTAGSQSTVNGVVVDDRYFVDLPDGPANINAPHQSAEPTLFYAGDIIHYYVEAIDALSSNPGVAVNTSTLPGDISGFMDFTPETAYNRVYTVRGLPGSRTGDQPSVLFWNDFGHRGGEAEYLLAFSQNGYREGVNYETYTTKGPSSLVGNGLGSAGHHGANPAQVAGYDCIVYVAGNLSNGLISDGTDLNGNGKSDDVSLMTSWHNQDAERFSVYFGDDFADGMINQGGATQTFVNTVVGVDAISGNVGPIIDDQSAAIVTPTAAAASCFTSDYVAFGGCLVINDFDEIAPFGTGPIISHEFTNKLGNPYATSVPASILWDRIETGNRKVTGAFAHGLIYINDVTGGGGGPVSARATVLGQIFDCWGKPSGLPGTNNESIGRRLTVTQNYPNPFNPSTTIKFSARGTGDVSLKIYNLRGELVRTMTQHVGAEGEYQFTWHGKDNAGAQVASGVYMYKVAGMGQEFVAKMALVK